MSETQATEHCVILPGLFGPGALSSNHKAPQQALASRKGGVRKAVVSQSRLPEGRGLEMAAPREMRGVVKGSWEAPSGL